jgi:hypothetical protein
MRYDTVTVYRKGPNEFFWVQGLEPTGEGICGRRDGGDYNKVPRVPGANFPMTRHGPADETKDRGNCVLQICVNDGVKARSRR